jgi:hypothetical protein
VKSTSSGKVVKDLVIVVSQGPLNYKYQSVIALGILLDFLLLGDRISSTVHRRRVKGMEYLYRYLAFRNVGGRLKDWKDKRLEHIFIHSKLPRSRAAGH